MAELSRGQMLEHLRSDYGGLRDVLERFGEEEALRPGLVGQWSARQLLAHIVGWEEEALERLRLIAANQRDQIRRIRSAEVDAWNAAAVERLSTLPWTDLLARWVRVRSELTQQLEDLTDEQVEPADGRFRVSKWLPDFAWSHEAEHAAEIKAE